MMQLIGQIIGGVGLFLIGTELLRRGFEESAGHSLRRILSDFTDKTSKGIVAGFVVSSAVQSATAVIFTLIGFVNSRLLQLRQAVAVVFGANLGKITIVLLITAVGFKFNIASYAMPILGMGALLKMFLKKRSAGVAMAFIGFGLLFLGLDTLKTSIVLINHEIDLRHITLVGQKGIFIYFMTGLLMTLITQSSTSPIVITLSALAGGIFTLENALALVIGENLGTCSSAIMASLGTTSAAKRLSAAHIIYNLISTVIGFVMLEILVLSDHVAWLTDLTHNDATVAFTVFYCVYIFMALVVLLPFKKELVKKLEKHFHNTKALGSPRFIEHGKAYHPLIAIQALQSEVLRFGKIASDMLDTALKWDVKNGWVYTTDLSYEERELDRLSEYIHWFASRTSRKQSSPEVLRAMQVLSMASRHFETVSDLSNQISEYKGRIAESLDGSHFFETIREWTETMRGILRRMDEPLKSGDLTEARNLDAEFSVLEDQKHKLRQELLNAGITKQMSSSQIIVFIDLMDSCRHAMRDQFRGIYETWEIKDIYARVAEQTNPEKRELYSVS